MKKIKILSAIIPALLALSSCEQEIMSYEGSESVWFGIRYGTGTNETSWPYVHEYTVPMFLYNTDQVEYLIKVMATGEPKSYDRPFNLEISRDSTTAVLNEDYLPLTGPFVIPAHGTAAYIPITFINTQKLLVEEVTVHLKLTENEHFTTTFPQFGPVPGLTGADIIPSGFDSSTFNLRANSFMTRPDNWMGQPHYNEPTRDHGILGIFSSLKMQFITDNFGYTWDQFNDPIATARPVQVMLANKMAEILWERYCAFDPVLDEDGRLMWVGGDNFDLLPWVSYQGQPWVEGDFSYIP